MRSRASDAFRASCFPAALTIAAAGLFVGLMGDPGGSNGFGVVRAGSDAAPGVAEPKDLAGRLEGIHRLAGIHPGQDSAWRDFARTMSQLEQLTGEYERRLASGERVDETAERARHALLFGSAMNRMDETLSPQQSAIVHRLTDELASKLICKGLSTS